MRSSDPTLAQDSFCGMANLQKTWLPWLLAIISGGLQVVIFPIPNWTFLCWIALAPLLIAILPRHARENPAGKPFVAVRRGFLLGWISGIIFYAGSCYWVYHVMAAYGGLATPVAVGVWESSSASTSDSFTDSSAPCSHSLRHVQPGDSAV